MRKWTEKYAEEELNKMIDKLVITVVEDMLDDYYGDMIVFDSKASMVRTLVNSYGMHKDDADSLFVEAE